MVKTASRFFDLQKKHKQALSKDGTPKNGQEFFFFENKFGKKTITAILNFKNGFLHSELDIPAVQMEDSHVEYWTNGYLSNSSKDQNGNIMPAVIANYGKIEEYWIDGEQINY